MHYLNKMKPIQTKKEGNIPKYIEFQFISNHIKNEITETPSDMMPDALRWRKISYLVKEGYLGRYPGYFLDGSVKNEDYLNKLLKMNIISQEDELNIASNNLITKIPNFNDNNKRYSLVDDIENSYYCAVKPIINNHNINNNNINNNNNYFNDFLKIKDLSLPTKIEQPKTETKVIISNENNSVIVNHIETMMFNMYPRGNSKSNFITIQLNNHITPLICIYYYEIEILNGLQNESDIVIGFIKDEKKNISYSSPPQMIDLRGTDDRAVGWYGKNGYLTIWNDKRIENKLCKFGKGDIIGFGYNLYRDVFFVTKNGLLIEEIKSVEKFLEKSFDGRKNVKGFIPSISLGSWCGVKINLGNNDENFGSFKFDINNYVKNNKYQFKNEIKNSKIIPFKLLPINKLIKTDLDLTYYVDELVIKYLKYGGYLDTVKALQKDLKDLQRNNLEKEDKINNHKLMELCELKKMVKILIFDNKFLNVRKLLEEKYPGFFTTYRKIDFKLRILTLISMLKSNIDDVIPCMKFASQLKNLFKEEEFQYYVDQVSILFSYEFPENQPEYIEFFDKNKIKIVHAIIMAINEQNELPFISSLDLVILKTDQNLEHYVDNIEGEKGPLLLNMLDDYIKF